MTGVSHRYIFAYWDRFPGTETSFLTPVDVCLRHDIYTIMPGFDMYRFNIGLAHENFCYIWLNVSMGARVYAMCGASEILTSIENPTSPERVYISILCLC